MKKSMIFVTICWAFSGFCQAEVENLASNPGFEVKDANGKVSAWDEKPPVYRFMDGVGRNGSRALVYENSDPQHYNFPTQRIKLQPGACYEYEVWVKTVDMEGPEKGATICIEWFQESKYLGGSYADGIIGTSDGWQLVQGRTSPIATNATHCTVALYVRRGMTGKAWFDDLVVKRYHPPLVTNLSVSNYRHVADKGNAIFSAVLALNQEAHKPEEFKGEFSWEQEHGTVVLRRPAQTLTEKRATCTLDVSTLEPGTYTVRFTLTSANNQLRGAAQTHFTRVHALPKRTVYIDQHNRTIVDDKPFFPLGMYWSGLNGKQKELEKYAQGPFNCLMPYGSPNIEQMDECLRLGLKVIYSIKDLYSGTTWAPKNMTNEVAEVAEIERRVNLYGKHPALLSWYINDELPLSMEKRLAARQRLLERLDPDHPTWVVLYQYREIDAYLATFDIIGTDPYPLPDKTVGLALEWTRSTRDLSYNTRALWQVPQVFDWGAYRSGDAQKTARAPTLSEMRAMAWHCIAAGANGLVFYSFFDLQKMNWRDPFEKRWQDVCTMAAEVKHYIPVILAIEPAPKVTSDNTAAIETRVWRKDGAVYLLAVNGSDTPITTTLSVEGGFKKVYTEFGPAPTEVSGSTIKVTLTPEGPLMLRMP